MTQMNGYSPSERALEHLLNDAANQIALSMKHARTGDINQYKLAQDGMHRVQTSLYAAAWMVADERALLIDKTETSEAK